VVFKDHAGFIHILRNSLCIILLSAECMLNVCGQTDRVFLLMSRIMSHYKDAFIEMLCFLNTLACA